MAQEEVIARRYAVGLAECAGEESGVEEVRRDVGRLAEVLDPRAGAGHVPEFLDFLNSPTIPPADKLRAAAGVTEKMGLGKVAADFLGVLIRHGRVGLMPRIARAFADIAGAMTGDLTAVVRTARPLSEDQAVRLTQALSAAFGGTVRLHQQVEPGLLAGAKVTVGDKTFDGSVLGRLENLKQRLMTAGLDGIGEMEEEGEEVKGKEAGR